MSAASHGVRRPLRRRDRKNVGHLLCVTEDSEGDAVIYWTDNRLSIVAWAYRDGDDIAALQEWWKNDAGPTL